MKISTLISILSFISSHFTSFTFSTPLDTENAIHVED